MKKNLFTKPMFSIIDFAVFACAVMLGNIISIVLGIIKAHQ